MIFKDLSDDVKLVVTKWLPKHVKILLLDVYPPVVIQIKSVSLEQLTLYKYQLTYEDIDQAVELYKRLTKVTTIVKSDVFDSLSGIATNYGDYNDLIDAIGCNLRPDIEYFIGFRRCYDYGFKYIELLHQKYPDFDGRLINQEFDDLDCDMAILFELYPNFKFKLHVNVVLSTTVGSTLHIYRFFDTIYRKLIKSLTIFASPKSVLTPMRLESLEKLIIEGDASFLIRNIENIRFLNPRIKSLEVTLNTIDDWNEANAINFTNKILSLENLESLIITDYSTCQWDDVNVENETRLAFYSMVTTLMKTKKRNLSYLTINLRIEGLNAMSILLWNNIRKGYKIFEIINRMEGSRKEWFGVDRHKMDIRYIEVSLIDLFNKFPHVKHIKVLTLNDTLNKLALIEELNVIRSELPRNRWLTLEIGGCLY